MSDEAPGTDGPVFPFDGHIYIPASSPQERVRTHQQDREIRALAGRIINLHEHLLRAEIAIYQEPPSLDDFRGQVKNDLEEFRRELLRIDGLGLGELEKLKRKLDGPRPGARDARAGATPEAIADEIGAPRAPTDVPVTPEPAPVLPTPAPGATSTPPPASSAAVKDAIAEGEKVGETEDTAIKTVKGETAAGVSADTPPKWQSKAAQQAIKTYVNRAMAHLNWILQNNQFLKRNRESADNFKRLAVQQFAIIEEYLKGVAAKDVVAFKQVVNAIANLQKLFERAVEETLVDIEASLAAIAHLKGTESTEYKMLDNLRTALKKRREVYDQFVAQLRAACPEALDGVNLEIPPRPEKPADVLVYRGDPSTLSFILSEIDSRIASWQIHWPDETIRHQQPAFQITLLTRWIADLFIKNRGGGILQDVLFNAIARNTRWFTPTTEQINEAIHAVLSCESGEQISGILPPVDMPPEDIAGEDKNLTEIAQEEKQPITQEMARTIFNNYDKLLKRSLLTQYAYPALSLKEKRAKVNEAYGLALKELEDTINNWNDGASIRAAGAIDALNTTLRADLERVDKAITIALERRMKSDKRKALLSDQKWRNVFLASLTQWERVVRQALKDLPARVGEKKD